MPSLHLQIQKWPILTLSHKIPIKTNFDVKKTNQKNQNDFVLNWNVVIYNIKTKGF